MGFVNIFSVIFSESLRAGDTHLYEVLGVEAGATDDQIKRAYRRLALRYHPDKNPGDADAERLFKEINYANNVLSNASKRAVYDAYGPMGLKMMDQIGEDRIPVFMLAQSRWAKVGVPLSIHDLQFIFIACGLLTGCYCCCCCCCCCNCCCGKLRPKMDDEHEQYEPAAFSGGTSANNTPFAQRRADESQPIVTEQPRRHSQQQQQQQNGGTTDRPAVIAMPPPPPPTVITITEPSNV